MPTGKPAADDEDERDEVERLVRQLTRVLAVHKRARQTCSVTEGGVQWTVRIDRAPSSELQPTRLHAMTEEFDALLARMQAPGAHKSMQAAFDADAVELGDAAVNAARRHG